VESES